MAARMAAEVLEGAGSYRGRVPCRVSAIGRASACDRDIWSPESSLCRLVQYVSTVYRISIYLLNGPGLLCQYLCGFGQTQLCSRSMLSLLKFVVHLLSYLGAFNKKGLCGSQITVPDCMCATYSQVRGQKLSVPYQSSVGNRDRYRGFNSGDILTLFLLPMDHHSSLLPGRCKHRKYFALFRLPRNWALIITSLGS